MTRPREVQEFRTGLVRWRITDCPNQGVTYALWAGHDDLPERQVKLFSGHVEPEMHEELRELAFALRQLSSRVEGNIPAEVSP